MSICLTSLNDFFFIRDGLYIKNEFESPYQKKIGSFKQWSAFSVNNCTWFADRFSIYFTKSLPNAYSRFIECRKLLNDIVLWRRKKLQLMTICLITVNSNREEFQTVVILEASTRESVPPKQRFSERWCLCGFTFITVEYDGNRYDSDL